MSGRRAIEWIGVRSPMQDERITHRKIMGLYSDKEEVLLEAVAKLVSPLIRQPGSTARGKGPADGYSEHMVWGPRYFVYEMLDVDADRLFKHDPDEYEFRDLNNPDHDDRKPIVPWPYINSALYRIIQEAENGPNVVLKGQRIAKNDYEVSKFLTEWEQDRIDEAKDRGVKLTDDLRIIKR